MRDVTRVSIFFPQIAQIFPQISQILMRKRLFCKQKSLASKPPSKPFTRAALAVREANPVGATGFGEAESAFVLRDCTTRCSEKRRPALKTTRKERKPRFCRKDCPFLLVLFFWARKRKVQSPEKDAMPRTERDNKTKRFQNKGLKTRAVARADTSAALQPGMARVLFIRKSPF